jgi:hypothetical protein
MTPKLTDEMRRAIKREPGKPVQVEDDRTHKVYFLVDREHAVDLFDHWLAQELQIGFDEADQKDTVPWSPDRIKVEGRRRFTPQP